MELQVGSGERPALWAILGEALGSTHHAGSGLASAVRTERKALLTLSFLLIRHKTNTSRS